jgi:FMNH2-dependent dimethyl sulfone monooxygenase
MEKIGSGAVEIFQHAVERIEFRGLLLGSPAALFTIANQSFEILLGRRGLRLQHAGLTDAIDLRDPIVLHLPPQRGEFGIDGRESLRHQRAIQFRRRSRSRRRLRSDRAPRGRARRARGPRGCGAVACRGPTGGVMTLKFGYWLPVFGGWLRNVDEEGMPATWEYVRDLAQRSERIGFDVTLVAELNLNDIKGIDAPSLDAWSTAAALAAVTRSLELMVAVRPTFHLPALLAKQAANIDHISNGRLTLNVVSSWWAGEARQYGVGFEQHDDRYARTSEWLDVLDGVWKQNHFSFSGKFYRVEDNVLEPKPVSKPRPTLYAGGESPAAKELIAEKCDAYLMHGDPPERVHEKITDMRERRAKHNLPPMKFGVAGYTIVRQTEREAQDELRRITDVQQSAAGYANYQEWLAGTQLEQRVSLEDYSVSNRGLRAGLVGTPEQVTERLAQFASSGVDLVLLQFSPQLEEMELFAETVIRPTRTNRIGSGSVSD